MDATSRRDDTHRRDGLVPALLRDWRRRRGLSQLDLAIAADVSSRHISFIETGRSTPSAEMVLCLGAACGVPLRDVDAMLRAAGHDELHGHLDGELPDSISRAIAMLGRHHDPAPLVVVDRLYDVVAVNRAGELMLSMFGGGSTDVDAGRPGANLVRTTFSADGAQPHIVNFDDVGRELLWRLHREVLDDPNDVELRALYDEVLELPTVPVDWRRPDLAVVAEPALVVHLRLDDLDLRFLTTVTAFQAPQNSIVERLRIESWIPADDATAEACAALVAAAP